MILTHHTGFAAAGALGRLVTSEAAPEARTAPYAELGVEVLRVPA